MKNEHKIDQLFKAGLEDPEIPFNEKDWEDMAKKLDAQHKKRILPIWWMAGAGVAAALLVFIFAIWFEKAPQKKELVKTKVENLNKKPGEKTGQFQAIAENLSRPVSANHVGNEVNWVQKKGTKAVEDLAGQNIQFHEQPLIALSPAFQPVNLPTDTAQFIPMKEVKEYAELKKSKYTSVKHSAISLSILAAPDISGTGSNLSSQLSSNFGLMATYPITPKISLSTGLIYAKKRYNSAGIGSINNGYGQQSWEVDADCKVLDIPLNVNYQVFKKQKLSVSINTGLSSYLMLNEQYQLLTGPERTLSRIEVNNKNQHIFGLANFSVSVERKLNSSLSIGIQPFVKLPLTGIGNYDVRLNSTGVSLSLSFSGLGKH